MRAYWYYEEDGKVYDDIRDILMQEVTDEEWQEYRNENEDSRDWCASKEDYIEYNIENRRWDEWGEWRIRLIEDTDAARADWLEADLACAIRSGRSYSVVDGKREVFRFRARRYPDDDAVVELCDMAGPRKDRTRTKLRGRVHTAANRHGDIIYLYAEIIGGAASTTMALDVKGVHVVYSDGEIVPNMDDIMLKPAEEQRKEAEE